MGMAEDGDKNERDATDGRIIRFPSQGEREKIQAEKQRQREKLNAQSTPRKIKPAKVPFINFDKISPFAGILVASFILIHLGLNLFADPMQRLQISYTFGFIPRGLTSLPVGDYAIPSLITHAFLHGSWMHLLFNAVMGLSLGIMFERLFGTRTAIVFFFTCTLAGALTYLAFNPFATAPMIGASGGISGYFGAALLMLHAQGRLGHHRSPWPMIILWGALISVPGMLMGETIAWQAHLGGYACGIALFTAMQSRRRRR